MKVKTIEFVDLENKILKTRKSFRDILASEIGKAYVVAITRDSCPACQRQKPKLDQLAHNLPVEKGDKTVFVWIHVKYSDESNEEALRSKDVLNHYFFPTNLILIRTKDRGATELYRNVSPRMSELKRNIDIAVKIADVVKNTKN